MTSTSPLFPEGPLQVPPLGVTLRPYQQEAVDALYAWFKTHTGNPLIVVPTGGGKSVILTSFVHSVLSQWPKERILVLTHVRELIDQNYRAMLRVWPTAPAGVYSAGLGRRERDAQVLFAGIQSVYNKAAVIGWADLIIVDEAHLIPAKGIGMYRTLLQDLRSMNSHAKVIGLTATPFRLDSGSLSDGADRMFEGVAYDCDLVQLIRDGYLSPVTSKGTRSSIDTSAVHMRGGEFIEGELEQAAMAGDNVSRAVAEIVARGQDRKAWLVFCCGVDHAKAVAAELRGKHGISVATVFGTTTGREEVVADFRAGKIQAIVNVNVLTTGFDVPHLDLIALLRPTLSPGLYVQMTGRGLRTAPGKTSCLVLDFGGNVMRHGPIDCVRIREPGKREAGSAPARECPECQTLVGIAVRQCPECGFEWVVADGETGEKHADRPDEQEIIAGLAGLAPTNPIERWDVSWTEVREHIGKNGKPNTLRVCYHSGLNQRVSEFVCFDHPEGSFPRKKATQWWKDRGGDMPTPSSVDEARVRIECHELDVVAAVTVDTRGEWPELRGVRLERREAGTVDYSDPAKVTLDESDLPF